MPSLRKDILFHVKERYCTEPDYPWIDTPDNTVLRHADTKKWYALIMTIPVRKLGIDDNRYADVLNVKCDPLMSGSLRMESGIYPAYHMNKNSWISILADGTVDIERIKFLIDMSYTLTSSKPKPASKN